MLSLESTGSRMSHLARQEIYFGRQFGLDETHRGDRAVAGRRRPADRHRALRRRRWTMSVLGNLKGYRPEGAPQLRDALHARSRSVAVFAWCPPDLVFN